MEPRLTQVQASASDAGSPSKAATEPGPPAHPPRDHSQPLLKRPWGRLEAAGQVHVQAGGLRPPLLMPTLSWWLPQLWSGQSGSHVRAAVGLGPTRVSRTGKGGTARGTFVVQSPCCVRLFATSWTEAGQASLSARVCLNSCPLIS